jgi:DNA-directed RNA polymerase specialized sigma24 family protein
LVDEITFIEQLQNAKTREQAFRKLVATYKQRLYWHIRKIVVSHDDADDVLQNSQLFSWMYRIATNESISFINKRARESNVDISDYQQKLTSNLSSDINFDGDAIQIILQKAIKRLPTKQQLVFNMKYFDDLKYSEMSKILETSEGALKASYFHAVKKIEEYIKSNEH